jgi:hypothetical protein
MARKRTAAETASVTLTAASADAGTAETAPARHRITLNRAVKVGPTWLRPNAARIVVDQATLEELQAQGAVDSAEAI